MIINAIIAEYNPFHTGHAYQLSECKRRLGADYTIVVMRGDFVQRGEPATFGVSQVIPGWVEALQLMPVGSKWRLFIPSNLAYGEHGAGDVIEPNSTLIFDVELLDIVK